MEIRVNVSGKVAFIEGASSDDKAKAELYPSGEGTRESETFQDVEG